MSIYTKVKNNDSLDFIVNKIPLFSDKRRANLCHKTNKNKRAFHGDEIYIYSSQDYGEPEQPTSNKSIGINKNITKADCAPKVDIYKDYI